MTKDKKLLLATYLLGLISLTVGLSIFLCWWAGKAWLLTNFHKLELWGFLWILISIPLGLAGLVTGVVALFRTTNNRIKSVWALLAVLVNIPVLIWILNTQDDIQLRAYVRIYNKTGTDFESVTIENSLYKEVVNAIEEGDYRTGFFYPNHTMDSVPEEEDVTITITTRDGERTLTMPSIYRGECVRISIDKGFKIRVE